jgi:hypothetical protein
VQGVIEMKDVAACNTGCEFDEGVELWPVRRKTGSAIAFASISENNAGPMAAMMNYILRTTDARLCPRFSNFAK